MKQIKEFLEYLAASLITFTPILIAAMLLVLAYGKRDSAHALQLETINHYDTADELFTQLLIEEHMVKHTHVDAIDQKEPVIQVSEYIVMPVKVRIYGR